MSKEEIRDEWAKQRGLKMARHSPHCVCSLLGKKGHCYSSICQNTVPSIDHPTLWKKDKKPALLVFQPYGLNSIEEIADLVNFCVARGLDCSIDTYPAWHNPGAVLHVEISVKEKTVKV